MKPSSIPRAKRLPPVLIGALTGMWLVLNGSVAPRVVITGLVLAAALTWASARMRPLQPRLHRAALVLPLLAAVLHDIVRSNISVAAIVLGLVRGREIRSAFVRVPLTLRDPHGLAVLAAIVTSTPGTVWVDYDAEANVLTLHVLDLRDEAEWIAWIKNRYESSLRKIFEGA